MKMKIGDRLKRGPVLCAEGYIFELERRGYIQAGSFVPEVVLENPEAVAQLHHDFLRAGSDVCVALTYYAHREKLRIIGKQDLLESLNRQALSIAKEVASDSNYDSPLVAGNICNTNIWNPNRLSTEREVKKIFEQQVFWAAEASVDLVIAETFYFTEEAICALETILEAGLDAVVTLAIHRNGKLRDGTTVEDATQRLEQAGASVVGANCIRGPQTLMPFVKNIRDHVSCPVAALPVAYRTTDSHPTFGSLVDRYSNKLAFPSALDPFTCSRFELADFTKQALSMGVRYLGACCGAGPHHIRSMAEALGRKPIASRFSPDMSKHYALGDDPSLQRHNLKYSVNL